MKIYKYELNNMCFLSSNTIMNMPGNKILDIQLQDDVIVAWVEIRDISILVERVFEFFVTGQEIPEGMGTDRKYLKTLQYNGFVAHVYEYLGV